MFDSLADRIREDERTGESRTVLIVRWLAVAVLSILLFGGLYYGVRMLE